MLKPVISASVIVVAAVLASPFAASRAFAQERVLTIFGDDKCPSNTICVTAPESERYRIPSDLRPRSSNPENTSWAVRSRATVQTGSSAPSACNTASNQGWSGCFAQDMARAREERSARGSSESLLRQGLVEVLGGE